MPIYVLPLLALLLNFLAFASSLRFVLSRQGLYWLVPMCISILLGWFSGTQLLAAVSLRQWGLVMDTAMTIVLLVLSALWYVGVITFHFALKKTVAHNKHLDETWKNYHEARYLEKVTLRNYRKKSRRQRRNNAPASTLPVIRAYPKQWVDLFD